MCVLETYNIWGEVSQLSKNDCEYGEQIYNISASGGLYSPYAVPIRSGLFSGEYMDNSFKNKKISILNNMYTVLSLPGSSGSGVYNSKGEICGNINISYRRSDISFGATRKQIINFLSSI